MVIGHRSYGHWSLGMPMTFDKGHARAINAIDQRHAHRSTITLLFASAVWCLLLLIYFLLLWINIRNNNLPCRKKNARSLSSQGLQGRMARIWRSCCWRRGTRWVIRKQCANDRAQPHSWQKHSAVLHSKLVPLFCLTMSYVVPLMIL